MRVAIVAPVNYPDLAGHLDTRDREVAAGERSASATAPTTLALKLLSAGHEVLLVTHGDGAEPHTLRGDGLEVVRVASRGRGRHRFKDVWRVERAGMRSALDSRRFDVVHAHWAYEHALAALAVRQPVAITIRDAPATVWRYAPDLERGIKYSMALTVALKSKNAAVAAVSPYMAEAWRRQTGFRGDINIVPNTFPTEVSTTQSKAEYPVVTEVADDGPRKNVLGLLRAFRLTRAAVGTARLQLIGRGLDQAGSIAERARDSGLAEGVDFMGVIPRDQVAYELRRSWVHAHASEEESFGNTVLEAMVSGTAVVGGFRSGAVPWLLEDGAAGVLTDVNSPSIFSNSLVSLLADRDRRERVEIAGATRAKQEFSPEVVLDAHFDLYERAIRERRRAR